ncbi:MAG: PKD domain-containing protein [Flavobacteriales bacterium]|nr:PKD domain-containing protein [Flavobacteriales bacterium]
MNRKLILAILALAIVPALCAQNNPHLTNPANDVAYALNTGQYPQQVIAMSPFAAGYVFLENDGMTFNLYDKDQLQALHMTPGSSEENSVHWHAYKMQLIGSQVPKTEGQGQQPWVRNFFLGQDRSMWRGNVPVYSHIHSKEIYSGIDLELTSEYNNIKYNFIVHPGSDAALIRWEYEGAEQVKLENGHLLIGTSVGTMREMKPYAYQVINGVKTLVKCEFSRQGDQLSFHLPDGYDISQTLIIDPVLVFSSYSGSTSDNWGYTATFDSQDHAYGAGIVGGAGYPTTTGAYDTSFNNGSWDIGITKFTPDGSDLVYSTYLGGSDTDLPSSMVVNNSNQLVIIGFTGSTNFPVSDNALYPSFQGGSISFPLGGVTFNNGTDIFITRFNEDGSDIVASTYIGGSGNDGTNDNISNNYGDVFRSEVVVDISNNVYVVSNTHSNDFPVTTGTAQQDLQGTQDAVVFKLNAMLSNLEWGTYWGGASNDSGYSIDVTNDFKVYVAGGTQSNNLPTTESAYQTDFGGGTDGYMLLLEDGELQACTYLGTSSYDQTFFIELDTQGKVWVTGQTEGDMTVTDGVYANDGAGQFIQKFAEDFSELEVASRFGNGAGFSQVNICPTAFLVDNCNRIFVSGWGGALNGQFGSTTGMPVTTDAYQTSTDGSDFYVVVFDADMADLIFGSFLGASNLGEHVDGGTSRFSPKGIVYQAVCAGCGGSDNFPTTNGAWSEDNNSTNCNLAVFKYDLEIESLVAVASASPQTQGCTPFTVQFSNFGSNSASDFWDFGNGDTTTDPEPEVTFDEPGVYTVIYIAEDPETCNLADTSYIEITVQDPLELNADFTVLSEPCQLNPDVVVNYTGGEYESIQWNMGDGGSANGENFVYTYDNTGDYTITLTVLDSFCDSEDSMSVDVEVETATVNAALSASPLVGCAPLEVDFTNAGSVGVDGAWDFGNGLGSTNDQETITYAQGGTYEVSYLIWEDGGPCSDTAFATIEVATPLQLTPLFTAEPPLCSDSLLIFVDYFGSEYDAIVWSMGDGTVISGVSDFQYLYEEPGQYEISVLIEDLNCDNAQEVSELVLVSNDNGIEGEVYFPNVISPDGNSINRWFQPYIVSAAGVKTVPEMEDVPSYFELFELVVFDRWGVKLFESTAQKPFWDPLTDNLPPDGVYYYIARYELACGNSPLRETHGHFSLLTK